tara:strand:+ start:8947 stop:10008 length:1062 start_codon:yes stop_codon:yes gene_type:complete
LKNLNALKIDNLYHSYEKNDFSQWILNSINFEIKQGELLGLLGPSGCGKTTLLRLIAGFEYPKRGKIILNEKEISNSKRVVAPENRGIGMVFQDYALFPHLTAFENAIFGLRNRKETSRVDYLLSVLGIENLKERYPHQLSGGQKQRLAIARALAPGTSFLLLDEPFCSLDLNVRLRLRGELPNILRECNASGLMVTHDPEEAMAICDKVAVMNQGKIHQFDKPQNIINNPKSLFVSSFILGNNIIKITIKNKLICSILGKIKIVNLPKKELQFLSISPKSFSLKETNEGNGLIMAKEFLGDYFIYKIRIGDVNLRVRTKTTQNISVGRKCNVSYIKGSQVFLFPGGFKKKIT